MSKTMWVKSATGKPVICTAKHEGGYAECKINKSMAEQGIPVEVPAIGAFADKCVAKKDRKQILEQCHDPKAAKATYDAYMDKRAKDVKAQKDTEADESKLIKKASKAAAKSVEATLKAGAVTNKEDAE